MDDFRFAQDPLWKTAWDERMNDFHHDFPTVREDLVKSIAKDKEVRNCVVVLSLFTHTHEPLFVFCLASCL